MSPGPRRQSNTSRPGSRRLLLPGRRRLAAAIAVAGALVVAGCSSSDGQDAADGGADVLGPSTLEGEATTIDGETFDLASLAGNELIVWFWAPW